MESKPNDRADHLTKREHFAGLALQGILAAQGQPATDEVLQSNCIVAAGCADMLCQVLSDPDFTPEGRDQA